MRGKEVQCYVVIFRTDFFFSYVQDAGEDEVR